ncbi:MAG: sensor histidine kinase, partial [Bacteroidales bacterium]|nr:sensor histidine kinase [Bacteroidales bacterium]
IAINDAQEEEKFRIAIDLHDGLGQILTAVSYAFQNFFGQNNPEDSEYQKNVNTVQSQIDAAIRESKNIAHNLIPLALKDFGLVVAINNLIEQVNQSSEIKFEFSTFNYKERINEKLEKAIFRIFQEAINNIIKHSKANNASFQINKYDDSIVISIEDDGIGFDLNEKTKSNKLEGIGLIGMRERISAFNGNLTINTEPNVGTEILIEIPCFEKKYEKN